MAIKADPNGEGASRPGDIRYTKPAKASNSPRPLHETGSFARIEGRQDHCHLYRSKQNERTGSRAQTDVG